MLNHTWTVDIIVGVPDAVPSWRCVECGAFGGQPLEGMAPPTLGPFLPESALELPLDCAASKAIVDHIQFLNHRIHNLQDAVLSAIDHLREEDLSPDPEKRFSCVFCTYKGMPAVFDCTCEDAATCTPDNPGPGCHNGMVYCPVCENLEKERVAAALMVLEKV